jgi:hypothetical protein
MLSFRSKQKKLEDFQNRKENSIGFTKIFWNWYLNEWKRKNFYKNKNMETKLQLNKETG